MYPCAGFEIPCYFHNNATEIDCPDGETPVKWMLLTTEVVADIEIASTILCWYSYRWRVEEYHKILKSGCQVERYRLAADAMRALIGFLSVIAVELLQLTYLHRLIDQRSPTTSTTTE